MNAVLCVIVGAVNAAWLALLADAGTSANPEFAGYSLAIITAIVNVLNVAAALHVRSDK